MAGLPPRGEPPTQSDQEPGSLSSFATSTTQIAAALAPSSSSSGASSSSSSFVSDAADETHHHDGSSCLPGPWQALLGSSPQPLCVLSLHLPDRCGTTTTRSAATAPRGFNAVGGGGGTAAGSRILGAVGASTSRSSGAGGGRSSAPPCALATYAVLPGGPPSGDMPSADISLPAPPPPPPRLSSAAVIDPDGGADDLLSHGDLLYSNDALSQLCGYTRQQLRRGGLGVLLRPPPTVAATAGCSAAADAAARLQGLQLLGASLTSGNPTQLELPCYHSSGRVMWVHVSMSLAEGSGGGGGQEDWEAGQDVTAASGGGGESSGAAGCAGGREPAAAPEAEGGWRRRHAGTGCCSLAEPAAATGCGVERVGCGLTAVQSAGSSSGGGGPSQTAIATGAWVGSSIRSSGGGTGVDHGGGSVRSVGMRGGMQRGGEEHCGGAVVSSGIANRNSCCECQTGPADAVQHRDPYVGRAADRPLLQQQQHQQPEQQRCEVQQEQQQRQRQQAGGILEEAAAAPERVLGRSDSHEWARRCQLEQRERLLLLRRLQLQEERLQEEVPREGQEGQQQQREQQQQQLQQHHHHQQQRRFLLVFNDLTAHKQLQQQLQQLQQPQQQPQLQQQQQQSQLQCNTESALRPASSSGAPELAPSPVPPPLALAPAGAGPATCPAASTSTSAATCTSSLIASLAAGMAEGGCAACRMYDYALDVLGEGITIADPSTPDNPIIYTNKAFLKMTGYSREEVLGRNCRFLQGPDTDPAVVAAIREAITRRQTVTVTLLNYTKSGGRFWNELRLEPVVVPRGLPAGGSGGGGGGGAESEGQLVAIIGVQNDVTELIARKQSEARLRDAKEAAESATEAKSQFLANMSHEIRTPLNGMIATAQLLLTSVLTPEQRELAETILESGSTLLGVLGDILDFSKIDHGSLELQQRPMCLRQATEACMDLVAAEAAKKGLSLAYLIDDLALARPLLGDPVRIRQVIANLLSNAVKFTERGEVVVRVSVEHAAGATTAASPLNAAADAASGGVTPAPATDSWRAAAPAAAADTDTGDADDDDATVVHITVTDTGIGISEESAGKLFQHFRQGTETMSRRYGGTGLGLAISKRLAKLMAGDIWMESRPGAGSTFHFTLRAEWASLEGAWPISPSRSASSTPAASSDCTPRSSTDEGCNHSGNISSGGGAAAAAAAALGLDSGGTSRWSNAPSSGGAGPSRLSSGSGGSGRSGRSGRELRTSPWMSDGTPIDSGEIAVGVGAEGGAAGAGASPSPRLASPPRVSGSGGGSTTGCGSGGGGGGGSCSLAAAAEMVVEERSALVGRSVLVDVSHAATSTQVWNSCRQFGLAAAQGNACALPPPPPPPAAEVLDAAAVSPAPALPPPGPRYDILVVSMDRLVPALKAGWKGRPVVAVGDRAMLPPALQPLVVALALPVRHSRLATALVKSTALLRWNGSSAPKLSNAPIPNESIQMLKSWRLKRGTDWDCINRRTSLDNSALERTNFMLRGAAATAPGGPGLGSGSGKVPLSAWQQQAPIPEHAELPAIPDDPAYSSGFCFPATLQAQIHAAQHAVASAVSSYSATAATAATAATVAPAPAPSAAAARAVAAAPCAAAGGTSGLDAAAQQQLQQQQLRILIAEDNKVNQKVVLKVLQQILRGCQPPDVVENGLQVLQALQKKTYDLILMDIHMPEMDGLEASKRIQETYKPEDRPRIIALSADTVQTLHDRCREAGIEAFLVKPFRIEELARVMRTGSARTLGPRKPLDGDALPGCSSPLAA